MRVSVAVAVDDGALVEALSARDSRARAALDTLYERHAPTVYGLLQTQLEGERAEAVLVETFVRLWTKPPVALQDSTQLVRWLLVHALHIAGPRVKFTDADGVVGLGGSRSSAEIEPRLEDVLITPELSRRIARAPNLGAENAAFFRIARQLATRQSSYSVLQTLIETAVELCGAGSAGLSIREAPPEGGEERLRWTHMTGALTSAIGGTIPRDFSPCGVTLDRGAPQLFQYPARYFTYFGETSPQIVEALIIPLPGGAGSDAPPVGTIWIASHDVEARPFDWEDARIMTSLASFTAISLQIAGCTADESIDPPQ